MAKPPMLSVVSRVGAICAPNYNKVGQLFSPVGATADGSLSYFLEHIAYPQREQIGRLVTSNLT